MALARELLFVLWYTLKALGTFLWSVSIRYPRHALAAAASL